jgi:hypothetical protein
MTTSLPVAEVIGEHVYGGLHTVRVTCSFCGRTHLHRWPTTDTTPVVAHCGGGTYRIETSRRREVLTQERN